ncbi:hypothetical protein GLOIN_2v990783 [Rhizophagus irregularis DAOM 181602=DAOM 197198]|uniref:Uncharacterized protein n=2 Tax=Rhizophagus irregularis TaxID=588596 RepID=A0A2P4NXA7_RHIID|nr:hypothetical protein GLOIN_2v990783 [Rhizophagus irregularis DAOM 181602=DAOM 197198]POG57775.1 hypothetical protein GLOIN_2v990783 [Rhizophagus irregularis DAOM 181602=DAOM 197198]|eukprot:XP_025164641.1 hypothetical protein GLOIN_2v990783 [Rhizophagus irregularis DAOM 181602=DAOM 197198]
MRYFKMTRQPITNILSSFINLKELELDCGRYCSWNCLENLCLPFLQILKAKTIPGEKLASLIENTGGYLNEISIEFSLPEEINNKKIIQAIYKKCPKLKYLKSIFLGENITEFEKILINCQYLDELFISVDNLFEPDKLFEILTKSSPTSLYKFRIWNLSKPESLKLFFDNWKGRHPMSFLEFDFKNGRDFTSDLLDLIKKYKGERVIANYSFRR